MENSSVMESYTAQMAAILRGLLACSPKTHKSTTYKALAEYLGVKQQSVSSWANGITIPDTKHIALIANYFGVTCDYLLGRESATSHTATDVCRETGLAPQAVEVLNTMVKCKRINELHGMTIQTMNDYVITAINYLITECNAALETIGIYLVGEFVGPDKVEVKDANINLVQANVFLRNGLLPDLTNKLQKLREMIVENGGSLPLTGVLEKTRADNKASFVKRRVEWLEQQRGMKLTEAERQEQADIWEREQQKTTEELILEFEAAANQK